MNKGYLISLAERYKEGEISKTMFQKFFECEYNCIAFELVSTKFNLLNLFVLVSELIQVGIILKKPKNPIFHIGGTVIRNDEIINANEIGRAHV